jgi:hypothetical protein
MRVLRRAMAFVPQGRCDRSQARSAWDSATQRSRPVRARSDSRERAHRFDDRRDQISNTTTRPTFSTRNNPRMSGIAMPDRTVPSGTTYILRAEALIKFPGPVGQRGDFIHTPVFGKCPNSRVRRDALPTSSTSQHAPRWLVGQVRP